MRNLARLVKIATKRIARNPYNAMAAVFVMFLTFFIAGAFVLITIGSSQLLSYFESRPQVTAFLKDDVTSSQVKSIQDELSKSGMVSKTRYLSKEEALKIYKERNQNEPLLNEFVSSEILPASIEVSTFKLDDLSKVAESLKSKSPVEEVVFQKDIIETLSKWSSTVRNIGIAVVGFLLVTSFLITLIVIGLNISLHKDEIEIMRLVGATSAYIRTPFIFEGVAYGVSSALLATTILWVVFTWASPVLQGVFSGIPILPPTFSLFGYLIAAELLIGSSIGIVGSFVATRKYLTV